MDVSVPYRKTESKTFGFRRRPHVPLRISVRLVGADLSRANLSGAELAYADLRYANLAGADLAGVIGADLSGTKNVPSKYR